MWLNEVCGIMSIHGEMPLNFNNPEKTEDTFISLKKSLFGELKGHEWDGNYYKPSNTEGQVTGGNLSLALQSYRNTGRACRQKEGYCLLKKSESIIIISTGCLHR